MEVSGQKYGRFIIGLLALGIVLFWGVTRPPFFAIDDAYITYRYAQNLSQGVGFVYNPGEAVLGTTAPMYAMILALFSLVVPNIELLGHWLSIAAWAAAALMTMPLLLQMKRPFAAHIAPLLIALQPTILKSVGMETPFLLFMMFLVAWAWLDGRKKTAVLAAAILLITRQDSALWLIVLGLTVWQREKRLPWREAVGTVALTLPWFAFAWWRYSSILPNSASAKIGQTSVMVVGSGIPFWQQLGLLLTTGTLSVAAVLLLTAVAALLLEYATRRDFVGVWLLVWIVGYTAVYSLLNVVNFNWYFVPPVAIFLLLVALGLDALVGRIQQLSRKFSEPRSWIGPAVGIILLLPLLLSFGTETWRTNQTPGVRADYFQIGQWLAANTAPEAVIATIEIGVIGYESQRPIVDTMGLVSPDLTQHQVGWVETLVYALNAHSPDYLVVLPNTAWDFLLPHWWFQAAYEPVKVYENATIYGHKLQGERLAFPIQANLSGGLQLTQLALSTSTVQPGSPVDAWVTVNVAQPQLSDYQLTLYLVDAHNEWFAVTKEFPFAGGYNSTKWQPGDELEIPVRLEIPQDLPEGSYQIGLLLFDPLLGGGLPKLSSPELLSPDIRAGWLRFGDPEMVDFETAVSLPIDVVWQNSLTLEALNIGPTLAGTMPLALVWQVGQPMPRDLTTFVHLLDAEGNIVAQVDERPFQGRWPTTVWRAGETIRQPIALSIPSDLPRDAVQLRVGLYDAAGRLPLGETDGDFWQFAVDLRSTMP